CVGSNSISAKMNSIASNMECRWASERLYSLTSTWRSSPTVRIGDEEERLKAVGLV
ncbi:MAG: hypothetical protein AVDCRST_MAG31-2026, partial [uncultured Sphingomonas sp.]